MVLECEDMLPRPCKDHSLGMNDPTTVHSSSFAHIPQRDQSSHEPSAEHALPIAAPSFRAITPARIPIGLSLPSKLGLADNGLPERPHTLHEQSRTGIYKFHR